MSMPTDQELSKFSDEHKAMLADKCVQLLMRGKGEDTEVCYLGNHLLCSPLGSVV